MGDAQREMWNRFFRGSKYEDKWLKRGKFAPESRAEEVKDWLGRLKAERSSEPAKPASNPFNKAA